MITCPKCGAMNHDDTVKCAACGTYYNPPTTPLTPAPHVYSPPTPPPYGTYTTPVPPPIYTAVPPPVYTPIPPALYNREGHDMALASLVLGIIACVCMGWGWIHSILAIALGCISKSKGYKGEMATAGIILGAISIFLFLLWLFIIFSTTFYYW